MEIIGNKIHVDSLEFLAAETCNLRCAHCTIASPFMRTPSFPDLEIFREVLPHLNNVLHCNWFSVVGGEPLINKHLPSILHVAKESDVFENIEISTNGILLDRMAEEVWNLIDRLRVTWYSNAREMPSATTLESLQDKALRHNVVFEFEPTTRFFRSLLDSPIDDENTVKEVFSKCAEVHEWSCHLLYGRRLYLCSRVPTIEKYLSSIGHERESLTEKDGILIDGRNTLFEELKVYFQRNVPLNACRYCLGTSGVSEIHRQLSKEEIDAKRAGKKDAFSKQLFVFNNSSKQLQEGAVRDELAYLDEQQSRNNDGPPKSPNERLLHEQSVLFKYGLLSADEFTTHCQEMVDRVPGSTLSFLAKSYLEQIQTTPSKDAMSELVWDPKSYDD